MAIGESLLLSFHPMYPLTNDPHANNHRASVCDACLGGDGYELRWLFQRPHLSSSKHFFSSEVEKRRDGKWTEWCSKEGDDISIVLDIFEDGAVCNQIRTMVEDKRYNKGRC